MYKFHLFIAPQERSRSTFHWIFHAYVSGLGTNGWVCWHAGLTYWRFWWSSSPAPIYYRRRQRQVSSTNDSGEHPRSFSHRSPYNNRAHQTRPWNMSKGPQHFFWILVLLTRTIWLQASSKCSHGHFIIR